MIVSDIDTICKNKSSDEILQLAVDYQYGTRETPKNVRIASELYLKAYNLGNLTAVIFLGMMFEQGIGVQVDYEKARHYFEIGVSNDFGECYTRLGILYLEGNGVKQDYKIALDYFYKGRGAGDVAEACLWLAYMYEHGFGVKQSNRFAIKFYEASAYAGNAYAQFQLGYMNEFGICTKINLNQARYYYRKALETNETREKAVERLNEVEKNIADKVYEEYKTRLISINEYCKLLGVSINEKEVNKFGEITKTNTDEVFNRMYQALNKYKVSQHYIQRILQDTDAWFSLYQNPEEMIKHFIGYKGKILSSFLYSYLCRYTIRTKTAELDNAKNTDDKKSEFARV